eukprot:TRINITY_DN1028_c4_g1_i2.p1 TRINITY_DN1028_c4_g1~~TRINITY_DN1028_c4_g1_i2.p1  ORF type:complete len:806 (+),score=402.69 TRINITY_DN1028_c4_g1_i2:74-2491(+)
MALPADGGSSDGSELPVLYVLEDEDELPLLPAGVGSPSVARRGSTAGSRPAPAAPGSGHYSPAPDVVIASPPRRRSVVQPAAPGASDARPEPAEREDRPPSDERSSLDGAGAARGLLRRLQAGKGSTGADPAPSLQISGGKATLLAADMERLVRELRQLRQLAERRAEQARHAADERQTLRRKVEQAEAKAAKARPLREQVAVEAQTLVAAEQQLKDLQSLREDDLSAYRQTRAALTVSVRHLRAAAGGGAAPAQATERVVAGLEVGVGELRERSAELERRLQQLRLHGDTARRELRQSVQQEGELAEALRGADGKAAAARADRDGLAAEIRNLQQGYDQELGRLSAQREALVAERREHDSAAGQQITTLSDEAFAAARRMQSLDEEVEALRRQNKAMEKEAKETRRRGDELETRLEAAEKEVAAVRGVVERAQAAEQRRSLLEDQLKAEKVKGVSLTRKLGRLQREADCGAERAEERGVLLAVAMERVAMLRSALDTEEEAGAELSVHRDRAAELEAELAAEHATALAVVDQLREEESRLSTIAADAEQADRRSAELEVELVEAGESVARAGHVSDEAGGRQELAVACADSRAALRTAETQREIAALQQKARVAAHELAQLERRLQTSAADTDRLSASGDGRRQSFSSPPHGGAQSPNSADAASLLQLCDDNTRLGQQISELSERVWAAGEVKASVERELRRKCDAVQQLDAAIAAHLLPGKDGGTPKARARRAAADLLQHTIEELMFQNIKLRDRAARLSCALREPMDEQPAEGAVPAPSSAAPEATAAALSQYVGTAAYSEL